MKAANHQIGKIKNPKKNNQACIGVPPRSTHPLNSKRLPPGALREGKESIQPVLWIGPGFLGSCIWKAVDRDIDGAWGETSAEIGIEAPDKLRRLDDSRCGRCDCD